MAKYFVSYFLKSKYISRKIFRKYCLQWVSILVLWCFLGISRKKISKFAFWNFSFEILPTRWSVSCETAEIAVCFDFFSLKTLGQNCFVVTSFHSRLRPYHRTRICSLTLKFCGWELGVGGNRIQNSGFGVRELKKLDECWIIRGIENNLI